MAKLSVNNRAHTQTYATLVLLKQIDDVAFNDAADTKMPELRFWSTVAGNDMRQQSAEALAQQIDNMFRSPEIWGAQLEPSVSLNQAISSLAKALFDAEGTILQLATVADDGYRFLGERT